MRLRLIVLLLSSFLLGCPADEPAATSPAASPAADAPAAPDAPDAPDAPAAPAGE